MECRACRLSVVACACASADPRSAGASLSMLIVGWRCPCTSATRERSMVAMSARASVARNHGSSGWRCSGGDRIVSGPACGVLAVTFDLELSLSGCLRRCCVELELEGRVDDGRSMRPARGASEAARQGLARLGRARHGMECLGGARQARRAWRGRTGRARRGGGGRRGAAWGEAGWDGHGEARFGEARRGRRGEAWSGQVRSGGAGRGWAGVERRGRAGMVRQGLAW